MSLRPRMLSLVRPLWVIMLILASSAAAGGPAGMAFASHDGREKPAGASLAQSPSVPNELLVLAPEGVDPSSPQLWARAGVRLLRTIPKLGIAVVATAPGADLAMAASDLEDRGLVTWAEPNYTIALDFVPNDPEYTRVQSRYLSRLNMSEGWDYTVGRREIIVAVIDTGVDLAHEDLVKNIWTNFGEIPDNGVDDDANGFVDDVHGWDFADGDNVPDDDYGHGTHVAGIIAGRVDNGIGIAGMAGMVTIMPVDVFPYPPLGTYEDLIRAIVYAADNGAQVINMSLGASSYSRGEEMAVAYAWSKDVVVVAAAGNTGRASVHYPAGHPHTIAVAATDANDNLAGFSTRGSFVDVAAPGVSIWSTKPGSLKYGWMSGTSMASPHVAGLAALVFSRNPTLTPDQVEQAIIGGVDDLGVAGWDNMFGYGRINAAKTLAAVEPGELPPPPPVEPLLEIWPDRCRDLIKGGGFESGPGLWGLSGAVAIDETRAYSGTLSAHFTGGPSASAELSYPISLPEYPKAGVLWFAYRIENNDQGWGSSPDFPFEDWFTAEFRDAANLQVASLLRTGNTADTATAGLPWDRYVYHLAWQDLTELGAGGVAALVFSFANDADDLSTDVWVDQVRLCVSDASAGYLSFHPLVAASDVVP